MQNWKLKLVFPIIYFIGVLLLFYFVSSKSGFALDTVQLTGIVIAIASFILWIISRIQLAGSFSVPPEASILVDSGIYSKIRHPVYVFSFLALLGIFLFLQNWILFLLLVPLMPLQIFRMRKEEEILTQEFGEDYATYKSNTWF